MSAIGRAGAPGYSKALALPLIVKSRFVTRVIVHVKLAGTARISSDSTSGRKSWLRRDFELRVEDLVR